MYGRDFSSQSSLTGRNNYKNENAVNLSNDIFQLLLPSGKNQSVRRPNTSVDGSSRSNKFSDSLLVMFSVTSRRGRPKRRPSWSIFLFIRHFGKAFTTTDRTTKKSESCDQRGQKASCSFTGPPCFWEVCLQISPR